MAADASSVEAATRLIQETQAFPDGDPTKTSLIETLFGLLRKEAHIALLRPQVLLDAIVFLDSSDLRVKVAALNFSEEMCCRVQGLGDLKWECLSVSAPRVLALLSDPNPQVAKRAAQWACSAYPAAYLRAITNPQAAHALWLLFAQIKDRARALVDSPHDGPRAAAIKLVEVLAVVHSVGEGRPDDISLDTIPPGHPYLDPAALRQEGLGAFNALMEMATAHGASTTTTTAALHALLFTARLRPALFPTVSTLLFSLARSLPHLHPSTATPAQKSGAKAVRNALMSTLRMNPEAPRALEAVDLLVHAGVKSYEFPPPLSSTARDRERERERERYAKRTRVAIAEDQAPPPKRPRTDAPPHVPTPQQQSSANSAAALQQLQHLQQMQQAAQVAQLQQFVAQHAKPAAVPVPAPRPGFSMMVGGVDVAQVPLQSLVDFLVGRLREVPVEAILAAQMNLTARAGPLSVPPPPPSVSASIPVVPIPLPATGGTRDPRRRDPRLAAKEAAASGGALAAIKSESAHSYFAPQTLGGVPNAPVSDAPSNIAPQLSLPSLSLPSLPALEVSSAPLSSYLTPPPEPTEEDKGRASVEALQRLLDADVNVQGKRFQGARAMWQVVVAKTVSGSGEGDSDTKGNVAVKDEMVIDEADVDRWRQEMRVMLVEHVCKDWRARNELCVLWLHEEYKNRPATYSKCLHLILPRLRTAFEARDRAFTKFLLDVPEFDSSALDVVRSYVEDPQRTHLGVQTLSALAVYRPAVATECLDSLLTYSVSPEKSVRTPSIITLRRWYPDNLVFAPKTEAFALEQLEQVSAMSAACADAGDEEGQVEDEEEEKKESDLEVVRRVELAFALSSRKNELLKSIFELYARLKPAFRRTLRNEIAPLVKNVGMTNSVLLDLIREPPSGSESLVVRTVTVLVDRNTKPTRELVAAVRANRSATDIAPRLLLPIMPYLPKSEAMHLLARVVVLLEGTPSSREAVKTALVGLVSLGGEAGDAAPAAGTMVPGGALEKAVMTPTELLIFLHNIPTQEDSAQDGVPVKKLVEATQICIDTPTVFTQNAVAAALQQLVDQSNIPILFMRTVMASVSKHKGLGGFVQSVLARLIAKKAWTLPKLWEGFVRCCRITQPHSYSVLLQLPRAQLQDVLQRAADLRPKLLQHLQSQVAPGQRPNAKIQAVYQLLSEQPGPPGQMHPGQPVQNGGGSQVASVAAVGRTPVKSEA